MKPIHRVAENLRIKYAYVVRERPMGNPADPDMVNVVKNIKDLIKGINYLSTQGGTLQPSVLNELQQQGVEITP